MHGGVRSPEVCNQLPVQYNGVVIVHVGYPVAMHACGNGSLVHKGDLGGSKRFECVNHLDCSRADGLASDPGLVFLVVYPTLLDDDEANVDDVEVVHPVAHTAGIHSPSEEAEDEGINPFGGVPIGNHVLQVCLAIFGCCLTVLVDKPEEEVDKDSIRLAKVPLLERSAHLG